METAPRPTMQGRPPEEADSQIEREPEEVAEEPPPRKHGRQKAWLLRWLHPGGVRWGTELDDFDPSAVEAARRWLGTFFGPRRYFRVEVAGWHHLPPPPVMLVSNHSGGTLFLDSWGLLWAWYTHFGDYERPLHPAVHEMLLGNRFTGRYFAERGAIRADRRLAQRVLERGDDLLVMPGGDLDVWRPFKDRYKVRFAGRKGYARIALQAGVPVVPVANAGAHHTLLVLTDGQKLAQALRLPQLVRAHIWPIHLSLPWGIGVGPWPHIPLPAKLRYRFGRAIHPEDVGAEPGAEVTDDAVDALDQRVRAGVQAQLDVLRDQRW